MVTRGIHTIKNVVLNGSTVDHILVCRPSCLDLIWMYLSVWKLSCSCISSLTHPSIIRQAFTMWPSQTDKTHVTWWWWEQQHGDEAVSLLYCPWYQVLSSQCLYLIKPQLPACGGRRPIWEQSTTVGYFQLSFWPVFTCVHAQWAWIAV